MRRPSGLGRWEGTDERLARVLDEILGEGCCEGLGDASEGPAFYSMIARSGKGRGGYVVRVDSLGFRSAFPFKTDAELATAWGLVLREVLGSEVSL